MDYQERKQMERKRAEDFIASINAMQDPDIMYKVSHPITDLKDMMNQSVERYGTDHVAFKQRFVKRLITDHIITAVILSYSTA